MLNNITIHGRLTADPELKHTQSQVAYCTFTVAVDRSYKQGDEKLTDFFNCIAWRGQAEMIAKYFNKGKEIVISGEMNNNPYEKDGNKLAWWQLHVHSIDFCGSKGNSSSGGVGSGPDDIPPGMTAIDDEEIPF
jgi:single-strand DNA-binding protein